jgi:hypothetical protein
MNHKHNMNNYILNILSIKMELIFINNWITSSGTLLFIPNYLKYSQFYQLALKNRSLLTILKQYKYIYLENGL